MPVFLSFFILFSVATHATVFLKQNVSEQLQEADGVVVGHYLKSRTIELDDGRLATQMIFKMTQEMGMQSELIKMDEIIVHYPGGTKDGMSVYVEGVPQFVQGERVTILIKNSDDRYWGLNLGMGAFRIVKYGEENILVNTVFPEDKKVGQIKFNEFEKTVEKIKGTHLKYVYSPIEIPSDSVAKKGDRSPASVEEEQVGKNRTIASDEKELENQERRSALEMGWLALALALLGGYYQLKRRGNNH